MSMTRKHFVAIAETLKGRKPDAPLYPTAGLNWVLTCQDFADMCARQNPNFDRDRFLRACGYDS